MSLPSKEAEDVLEEILERNRKRSSAALRASSSQSQRGIRKVGKRLGTVYGGAKNVG